MMADCPVCQGWTHTEAEDSCPHCRGEGIITQAALSERTTEAAEAAYELQLTGEI